MHPSLTLTLAEKPKGMDFVNVGAEEVKFDNYDSEMKKQGEVKDLPFHNCAEDNPATKNASDLLSLCHICQSAAFVYLSKCPPEPILH